MAFVNLDRRFRALDPAEGTEKAAMDSYSALVEGRDSGIGWSALLTRPLVVILGEPGSGKTYELRHQAEMLAERGQVSFYLRLDALASEPLEQVLGLEDRRKLTRWIRSRRKATFFLDSVDEAKLRVVADFPRALERFRNGVGLQALTRATVVLTSRISEWRPKTDAEAVLRALSIPETKRASTQAAGRLRDRAEHTPPLYVAQIEPLDRIRVRKFAESSGIEAPERFVTELDRHHAWMFARRPIDVSGLIGFWSRNNRLGSLTELIEHDVQHKLQESEPRAANDPLTPELGRAGAETLAASAILCRTLAFRVQEDAAIDDGSSLDAASCLPANWTAAQQRALMNRALFDGEAYGRIRFHHRRVAEYLAAAWLTERMRQGCPIRTLRDVLIDDTSATSVVRPSMAPVAAWLANGADPWNEQVRQWILKAAPWLHFQQGDPAALPLEYKRRLLQALTQRFRNRRRVWIELDREILARLSDPALAGDVATMIRDRALSPDLRADMLTFARHGQLRGCLDAALEVVASNQEEDNLKSYAAAVLRDVGTIEHLRRLAAIAEPVDQFDNSLCGHICEALYPTVVDAAGLTRILRKAGPVRRHSVGLPWMIKQLVDEKLEGATSAALITELIRLGREQPHMRGNNRVSQVSERFYWIGEVLPTALLRLLSRPALSPAEVEVAVEAYWILADVERVDRQHHREEVKALPERSLDHPDVRQAYMWRLVDRWRAEHGKEPSWVHQIYDYYSVLKADPRDLNWLIRDIERRPDERDRLLALTFSWDLVGSRPGALRDHLRHVRAAMPRANTRRAYLRLLASAIPRRLQRIWYRHFSHKLAEGWWWRQRFHRVQRLRVWLNDQWMLTTRIWKLISGQQMIWLSWLAREAAKAGDHQHWAPTSWDELRKRRGRLITWATRRGCIKAWRSFRPLLPHERPDSNSTDVRIVMGLAGLNSATADGQLDLASLSDEEARLAVRYSVNELNGFAPWMDQLTRAKPEAVRAELAVCIAGEWQFPAEREHVHEVLADLIWREDQAASLVVTDVLQLLSAADPPNIRILEQALSLLLRHGSDYLEAIESLARVRTNQYDDTSRGFFLWLSVWIQVNAADALAVLGARLQASANPTELMLALSTELKGERSGRSPLVENPSYLEPEVLRDFIPLVFRHVRPAEDVNRANGGVYSPDQRDHAQNFRETLLRRLAESSAAGTEQALVGLANDPVMELNREWILHLVDERRVRMADGPPWRPRDIRAYAVEYETDPQTERQLFQIAIRRLLDIKDHLETDDNSPRGEVREDQVEAFLRSWLARKLRERSRNRYTIPQEEEIALGHPDLRFENPRTGPVSVEIKWAHRWTLPQLLHGLEGQLVGQYMRARGSGHGIYLIGYIGGQEYWVHDGRRYTFAELVTTLEQRAEQLRATRPEVHALQVITLDFRPPRARPFRGVEA